MFSFYRLIDGLELTEGFFKSDPKERIQRLQGFIKKCEIAKKNCPRLVKQGKEWGMSIQI